MSPHQKKKALSPFCHEKYFYPMSVLHSFSMKIFFMIKWTLGFFYFDVVIWYIV